MQGSARSIASSLSHQTIVVTGASKGIGEATARHLASLGARVVLLARNIAACQAIAADIKANGGHALPIEADVADPSALAHALDVTETHYGVPQVMVNNAGTIEPIARLAESEMDAWSTAVDVNLKGVYYGMRLAIPRMLAAGSGIVINVSSGAATGALEGWSAYCATKAAVLSLTRCGHLEYASHGIHVVGMSPGTVATDMQASIRDSGVNPVSQKAWDSHIPPLYAAKAIAYLCAGGAARFAGQDFSIKTNEGRALAGLPAVGDEHAT